MNIPLQEKTFLDGEADAWFKRCKKVLINPEHSDRDFPLQLIRDSKCSPKNVLEIGCSNGWRLSKIKEEFSCQCFGIDPSQEAIRDGKVRYPKIELYHGIASQLPVLPVETFDLVIVNFVFHWISRELLFKSVATIDSLTANNGFLIVGDFLPDYACRTPYHHLPNKELYTYKLDYAEIFLSTALYTRASLTTFDHDNKNEFSNIPSNRRGFVSLLRKSMTEFYPVLKMQ